MFHVKHSARPPAGPLRAGGRKTVGWTAVPSIPPEIDPRKFARAAAPEVAERLELLWEEVRRWSTRVSLVSVSAGDDPFERHFGESLAAVPWLPDRGALVDIGSGGGFPGLVLAAARPDLDVVLVESRERKSAFLRSAARKMGLESRILTAHVARPLPEGLPERIDCLTSRAVRLEDEVWQALIDRLGPGGRLLLWKTDERLPPGARHVATEPLRGGERRCLVIGDRGGGTKERR